MSALDLYKIVFHHQPNLYQEGSPVVVRAGALVLNTESNGVHIQLKFENVTNRIITMLKVKSVYQDTVGRALGETEYQYLDLRVGANEEFGGNVPQAVADSSVRKFTAYVTEVCFLDGSIWRSEDSVWEKLPDQASLETKMKTFEATEQFKKLHGRNAKYFPLHWKDIWLCACGNVNKEGHTICKKCNARLEHMETADAAAYKKDYIYYKATDLVNKQDSSKMKQGITLLEGIADWKDSKRLLEEAKKTLLAIEKKEKDAQEEKAKRKKNSIIAIISCVAVAVLIIGVNIVNSIPKEKAYKQAQKYIAQHKYSEAMDLLDDLDGYKDADELYTRASYMNSGNYKEVVKMDNLTEFVIPDGVTLIGAYEFYGCSSLTSVVIPDSVTSIEVFAFYGCSGLTSVVIPDSVTSIGDWAFGECSSLTRVEIGDSVTSIGYSAFSGCPIKNATMPARVCSYVKNEKLKLVIITSGDIPKSAFYGCSSLTSVEIGDSVTLIGAYAFSGCSSLTSVEIGDSVTSIGDWAFSGYSSLTSVVIGANVKTIGNYAFYGWSIYGWSELDAVYYAGTAEDWNKISIASDNNQLTSAMRYYYSETKPTATGNYWHYVNGVPTKW
ncbi:MAG: leucine-rich repeat protein [Clostridia bacterium]|nr:leucine-rich repeat protein [Clostridia bacterium]